MENAADALKMAAFVLMFVGALTIAMITLSKAKVASEAIVYTQDQSNYYTYAEDQTIKNLTDAKGNRIVRMESIIPTLYRYYIEAYRIEFFDKDGKKLALYNNKYR